MIENKTKLYKSPLQNSLAYVVMPSILFLTGIVLLLLWIVAISNVLPSIDWGSPRSSGYVGLLIGAGVCLLLGGTMLARYTEVVVTEAGMKVRIFVFIWVFIPWEDVMDIVVPPILSSRQLNLWHFIKVRRLTPFHRLVSMTYQTGLRPVLVISEQIEEHDELLQIVREHIEQGQ